MVPSLKLRAAMLRLLCRAAPASRIQQQLRPLWNPSTLPFHSASVFSHRSPSVSVYRARQPEEARESEQQPQSQPQQSVQPDSARTARRAASGGRRRRTDTFRGRHAEASNLSSSSPVTDTASSAAPPADDSDSAPSKRPSRRSHTGSQSSAELDSGSERWQQSEARNSSARSSSSSSSSSSQSSSPRRPSLSSFGSSSVTARPSFGIQQVLAFVYSYLPRPTPAQTAAAHLTQQQPQSQLRQPRSVSRSPTPLLSAPCPLPHPVSVYDVSSRSLFNDFVVVLSVSSSRQMSFLSSALYKLARASNAAPLNRGLLSLSGRSRDDWQSVDLGSVVVHVFNSRARLSQPGLDYHPEAAMDDETQTGNGGVAAVRADEQRRDDGLLRHAVIDNIERQFGDLLVPLDQYDALRDYASSEAEQGGRRGEADTMLVDDTPPRYSTEPSSTAGSTTQSGSADHAAVK